MPITTALDDIPHHVIGEGDRGEDDNRETSTSDEHQEDEQELSNGSGPRQLTQHSSSRTNTPQTPTSSMQSPCCSGPSGNGTAATA